MIPLAALLGPWCVPGEPACAFSLDEDAVELESTNTTRPWTLEGDVLTLDPGGEQESIFEILSAGERWLQARPPGGEPTWFYREASDLPPELLDGYRERWPMVAQPVRPTPWRLSADRDWEESRYLSGVYGPLTVAERAPEALRLIGEWHGVRLSVWVRAEGFEERLAVDTTITPGVTALSGARVMRLGPAEGGLVPVRINDDVWSYTGVAPEEALDIAWRYREPAPTGSRPIEGERLLLYQSAAGDQVLGAFSRDEGGWWIERRGETPRGGRIPVVVRTDDLRLEGWTDASLLEDEIGEGVGGGGSSGGFWGSSHSTPVEVAPGSPLYKDGALLGVALEEPLLRAGWGVEPEGDPPRLSVEIQMPWGYTSLEVDCGALERAQDEYGAVIRCSP